MSEALPAVPPARVLGDLIRRTATGQVALVLGGATFVGLSAQIAIPLPFTPVPLTLQTFAVLLTGAVLGSRRGVISMGLYAVAGAIGVPWFAGGESGVSAASFGFILGFVAAAYVVGRIAEDGATRTSGRTALLMIMGNLVIYAVGVPWLAWSLGVGWYTALGLGLFPFVLGDAIKIAVAAFALPATWRLLGMRGA